MPNARALLTLMLKNMSVKEDADVFWASLNIYARSAFVVSAALTVQLSVLLQAPTTISSRVHKVNQQ